MVAAFYLAWFFVAALPAWPRFAAASPSLVFALVFLAVAVLPVAGSTQRRGPFFDRFHFFFA